MKAEGGGEQAMADQSPLPRHLPSSPSFSWQNSRQIVQIQMCDLEKGMRGIQKASNHVLREAPQTEAGGQRSHEVPTDGKGEGNLGFWRI